MPDNPIIYWDANVLLSYIEDTPGRTAVIEPIFERATKGEIRIATSVVSRVEVAFLPSEHVDEEDDPDADDPVAELWKPASPLTPVEFHDGIADIARKLVRTAKAREWSLKPLDAIHIASAVFVNAAEMHTYDTKLHRFAEDAGLPITEPTTAQEQLRPAAEYGDGS